MCILKTFGLGPRQTTLRYGCIIISMVKMSASLLHLPLLGNSSVKESSWQLTFLIIWTVLAVAFWIVLLTGALIRNSTMIAISLIGLILNLLAHASFHTVFSIYMFSANLIILAVPIIIFLVGYICVDIYFAWVLGSFCHELRNGESGSSLPYRT